MAQWVDFAEIRARVSLRQVLFDYYDLKNLRVTGEKANGPCPVHGGDSPRAFHADLSRSLWHCFSRCQRGGNQLDLVALRENISIREAALRLKARYLTGADTASDTRTPSSRTGGRRSTGRAPAPSQPSAANDDAEAAPVRANPPLSLTLNLKPWHPHLRQRGLTEQTIEHFGLGYCSAGTLRGMIAIPIHNAEGVLVAYAGRRLKARDIEQYGKYKLPRGFAKELELYNLHRANAAGEGKRLIVVEGFFGVFALHQAGFPETVALMGCSASDAQCERLRPAQEVILLLDGNDAGRTGARALAAQLTDHTLARVITLPEELQPDDLSARALRWAIRGVRELDLARLTFSFGVVPPKQPPETEGDTPS